MIVLRCTNEEGIVADLDLFQGDDLTLDISAIEAGEIGEVFGISSQQFALPGTNKNNQFFGNLYNVGATPATGFTKTVPCEVLYNGDEVFSGKLYIENVVTNQKGDTIYNVVVVNEVVDFKFQIDDLVMQDLVWSDYDHTLTMTAVTSSWVGNLFSGDILYPLVNYGINPDDPQSPYIEAGGDTKQFDNSNTPLREIDFRPAVKAKAVIDKIFGATNYSYSSSFFDSAYFDNLYILSTQATDGNQFASPTTASLDARVGSTQNLSNNTPAYVNFATEIFDNSNAWSTNEYTAPSDGDYTFYAQINFGNITGTRPLSNEFLILDWFDPTGATVVATTTIDISQTTAPQTYIGPTIINMVAGDKIRLRATISTGAGYSATYPIVTGKITVDGNPVYKGGPVDISKIWKDDTKVLDVLTGLINKFNLVFEPIVDDRNVILVEPFNDWVDLGVETDWTNKVDRSIKWEITHPLQSQPRNLKFTDISDTDALNQYSEEKFKKIYGEFNYVSDSDLASGEKTIGSYFSPFPMKAIAGTRKMIVPALAQKQPGEPLSPYLYNPRITYYVGLVSGSTELKGHDAATGTNYHGKYWLRNDAGTSITSSHYPLVHHLELQVGSDGIVQDADFDDTRDLHYGNILSPGHWSFHQQQYNAYTKRSAFYDYWSYYINEIYDVDTRQVTLNIKLKPSEIQDIRLNDKIFIDGAYYRINKISGANLFKESSVQVSLLKTLPRKLRFPRRRYLDLGTNEPIDVTISESGLVRGGGVVYENYNTGQVITGSAVLAVANKDGVTTYDNGSSNVWNNISPATYTLVSQNNFGNNQIEDSANKVNVTGENNVLKAQTSNLSVVGVNNTVSEYTTYSSVVGTGNTLGLGSTNVQVLGNNHTTISGSTDSTLLGGNGNTVNSSSLVTILGGASNTIKNSNTSRNVTIGGLNSVSDNNQTTTIINNQSQTWVSGSGHTLLNSPEVRSQNFQNFRNGSVITDDLYLGGAYFYTPKTLTISQTGSIDLQSPAYFSDYTFMLNFVDAGTGPGDGIIYLPSISGSANYQNQEGRAIRFKGIGNLPVGVSKDIHIQVANNDTGSLNPTTIEGANYFQLREPYDAVTLMAYNSQWYIIQSRG